MIKINPENKKTFLYLLVILVAAFLIRVIWLANIPNGFFLDEASDGYDAYSLLETGRDKYGNFFPLFLTGIGTDYRESLSVFMTIPFVSIFGLNEFSTRFAIAIIGTFNVILVYFLAKNLFNRSTGLIAALFLAISPWHIQYSRIAFRSILLPFLFCLALLFFVKSFRNTKYLSLSGLLFGISLYTYTSSRVFVPLFLLGITIIFWRHFWNHKKQALLGSILFISIFIPLLLFWISPEGMTRANSVGIVTDPVIILKNYLSYFSPDFLFLNGDPEPRHSPAKIGELHYFEFVTIIAGLWYLFRARENKNKPTRAILILWLLLYPIPAALTEPSHATRSLVGAPLFAILSAYGAGKLFQLLRARKSVKIMIAGFVLAASLAIFWKRYFIDYPLYAKDNWQYGFREAITYAQNSPHKCVVMSYQKYHTFSIKSFSVFIPFYTQYDPAEYQRSPLKSWIRNPQEIYSIGKYSLMSIADLKDIDESCLYIIYPGKLDAILAKGYQLKELHSVKDERGVEYFKIGELRKKG